METNIFISIFQIFSKILTIKRLFTKTIILESTRKMFWWITKLFITLKTQVYLTGSVVIAHVRVLVSFHVSVYYSLRFLCIKVFIDCQYYSIFDFTGFFNQACFWRESLLILKMGLIYLMYWTSQNVDASVWFDVNTHFRSCSSSLHSPFIWSLSCFFFCYFVLGTFFLAYPTLTIFPQKPFDMVSIFFMCAAFGRVFYTTFL